MEKKRFLAAILLAVVFCFVVSGMGYGEIEELVKGGEYSPIAFYLLNAKVNYMMYNPNTFLNVAFAYDYWGSWAEFFPQGIYTEQKICVMIIDNRARFSDKSGTVLLEQFKQSLEVIYSFIEPLATDMNADVVAKFLSEDKEGGELGYFYQGEYHLWNE